jgi:hypothetical protein
VHCEEAIGGADVDFSLPSSENSVEVCFICHKNSGIVGKNPIKRTATVLQFATILYGWKFRSVYKILTLLSDIPRATECLLAERLGLLMND